MSTSCVTLIWEFLEKVRIQPTFYKSAPVILRTNKTCPIISLIMSAISVQLLLLACRNEINCEEQKVPIGYISTQSLAWLYVQFLFLHFPHLSKSVFVPCTVANWASLIASFKNLFRRLFISSLAISWKCAQTQQFTIQLYEEIARNSKQPIKVT